MSASLVGSEMCIRDRSREVLQGLASVPWGVAGRVRACGRRPAAGDPAVSYTHLTLPTICSV
eukprot:14469687-Alexandrium_andersonii.AAC.1